ncbi:TIM barrel protein [Clostridium sp. MCC353]|uniref:sugar phosphate isomerase/epimerase family protein n=1 Tax=Clostridium sp. MCC353 TaxID=2592646 RepID=UPI001C016E4A|nr:sugar phosphate isomerase/epimerase family protein [Clostridium sp. MCC353]MBT9775639.1 TIM barrel protein [Clostridium sp. MCC353]
MILSTVTDEVLPDRSAGAFPRIFETAGKEGVTNFEIRMVEAKRFPLSEAQAWNRMKYFAGQYGITFSAVSPGLYKPGLYNDLMPLHRDYLLSMSMDLADRIGVKTIIVFGVERDPRDREDDFYRVAGLMRETAEKAAANGFTVQLENLPGTWADTSDNCLRLLQEVDHPAFGCIWDTGNFYEAEQTHFRAGYEKLKPYIRNVHLKDGRIIGGRMHWQHLGTGVTDIKGQIEALKTDGYAGTLTLEAKCEPHLDEDFTKSIQYLKSVLE